MDEIYGPIINLVKLNHPPFPCFDIIWNYDIIVKFYITWIISFFFYNSKPSQPSIKIPLLSCPIKTSQYVFKPSTHSAFCSLRDMYTNQGTQPAPMTTTIEWGILAGEICYSVIIKSSFSKYYCLWIYIYIFLDLACK